MKTCNNCQKENPDDFKFCRYCGSTLFNASSEGARSIWKKIPSWSWIIIFVLAIGGVIVAILGSFIALATIEGVASIVLLICGIVGFGVIPLRRPSNMGNFGKGVFIAFFALMGATIDQTGNYIYNKPVEMCLCDEGTSLTRGEIVSNPLPGTTYIEQDFTCFDEAGTPVKQLNMFAILGIRFLEYVLLAYLLLALRKLIWRVLHNTNA